MACAGIRPLPHGWGRLSSIAHYDVLWYDIDEIWQGGVRYAKHQRLLTHTQPSGVFAGFWGSTREGWKAVLRRRADRRAFYATSAGRGRRAATLPAQLHSHRLPTHRTSGDPIKYNGHRAGDIMRLRGRTFRPPSSNLDHYLFLRTQSNNHSIINNMGMHGRVELCFFCALWQV